MVMSEPLGKGSTCRYLRWAARYAGYSDHSIHKMGAVLIRKGQIVGAGCNKNRSHPKSKSFEHFVHAELSALISAGFVWGTYSTHLYVVRITRGGSMGTSKPCSDCMDLIKQAGVETMTYIDENGRIKKETL